MLLDGGRNLGDGSPDGDELEIIGESRLDGHHVVFMAVHVEALQEPWIAWSVIRRTRSILHSSVCRTQGTAHHEPGRRLLGVNALQVHEEGARRDHAQVTTSRW